jgi:hypothetical protein
MVSEQTIKEFQEAVQKEYGLILSEKDAKEVLLNWVAYFDLLAKIYHRDQVITKEHQGLSINPL